MFIYLCWNQPPGPVHRSPCPFSFQLAHLLCDKDVYHPRVRLGIGVGAKWLREGGTACGVLTSASLLRSSDNVFATPGTWSTNRGSKDALLYNRASSLPIMLADDGTFILAVIANAL